MAVKNGDRVMVDGRESVVTSSWGQGKHRAFALEDGRTVLDLTDEQIVAANVSKPSAKINFGTDDTEEEDFRSPRRKRD
jgi:hypothetical protein